MWTKKFNNGLDCVTNLLQKIIYYRHIFILSFLADEPSLQKTKSRSLEGTNIAMWSDEVEYVDLIKADKGLGFSILDYQDPLDPKSTVIVVRSVIPNGPAEQNGKIMPGDKLISVNGKVIKNVTLDQAVQALKGTLPGIVRLGISKPLPSVVV